MQLGHWYMPLKADSCKSDLGALGWGTGVWGWGCHRGIPMGH